MPLVRAGGDAGGNIGYYAAAALITAAVHLCCFTITSASTAGLQMVNHSSSAASIVLGDTLGRQSAQNPTFGSEMKTNDADATLVMAYRYADGERNNSSALLLAEHSNSQSSANNDLKVSSGTYLGNQTTQIAPVAVAVLDDGAAVVAGNGQFLFGRSHPDVLVQGSNGTLFVVDKTSVVTTLARVGDRLDDVAVVAEFGSRVRRFRRACCRHKPNPLAQSGTTQLMIIISPQKTLGQRAVRLQHNRMLRSLPMVRLWLQLGRRKVIKRAHPLSTQWRWCPTRPAQQDRRNCSDVALDADGSTVLFSFHVTHTGKEPIIMPAMHAYSKTLKPKWIDYDWDAHKLRPPDPKAVRCAGQVADSRVLAISARSTASLLFCGHSDGGDSMFVCQPNNLNKSAPFGKVLPPPWVNRMTSQRRACHTLPRWTATGEVVNSPFNLARQSSGRGKPSIAWGSLLMRLVSSM